MALTHHLMTMIIRQVRYQQREEIPVHGEASLLAGLHPVSVGLRPDNVDLKERTDPEDNLLRRKSAGDVLPGKKL